MSETPQDYPNIRAMAAGTISGAWREWPLVRGEAKALLAERDTLRAEVKRQVQTGVEWAATWASNQAELVSLRQRADDCCRIGEQTCAALVAERDALRAEIARRDHVAHVNASWRPDR